MVLRQDQLNATMLITYKGLVGYLSSRLHLTCLIPSVQYMVPGRASISVGVTNLGLTLHNTTTVFVKSSLNAQDLYHPNTGPLLLNKLIITSTICKILDSCPSVPVP